MKEILTTVTLHHDSALPEDDMVNTFHFLSDTATDIDVDLGTDIQTELDPFYTSAHSPATNSIGSLLSQQLNGNATVKCYDLSDPTPRVPFHTGTFTFSPASGGTGGLPSEVALCLSYSGFPVSGTPAARRRGRVFIGPLQNNTLTNGRPTAALMDAVGYAGKTLRDATIGPDTYVWAIRSKVNNSSTKVMNLYVDNAFDTQRRRGEAPTARTTY